MNILEKLHQQHKYTTDKMQSKDYLNSYCFHFDKFREKIKTFLEIGVLRGESLVMWADYFPNANIIGVDTRTSYVPSNDRIKVEIGDATNADFIKFITNKYGMFDIVLDDGSHYSSHMRRSFNLLYPFTNYLYCIEDLGTQYENPWGKFLDGQSMMVDLYNLVDSNNINNKADFVDYMQVCFSRMQCFIYKNKCLEMLNN
jgi:hypothetical protein